MVINRESVDRERKRDTRGKSLEIKQNIVILSFVSIKVD